MLGLYFAMVLIGLAVLYFMAHLPAVGYLLILMSLLTAAGTLYRLRTHGGDL